MIGAFIFSIITGLLLIFTKYIVEKYPQIIAGYDKLDESGKKEFLSLVKKSCLINGILIIVGSIIFYWIESNILFSITLICPISCMCIFLAVKGNRISKKK